MTQNKSINQELHDHDENSLPEWISVEYQLPQQTAMYTCKDLQGNEFPAWWVLQHNGKRSWLTLFRTVHFWKQNAVKITCNDRN